MDIVSGAAILDTVSGGKAGKFRDAIFCLQARHKQHICSESDARVARFVRRRVTNITVARKVTPRGLDFVRRRVTNNTSLLESDALF